MSQQSDPFEGYDHDLYLKNCKKMIRLNQERLDETLEEFHKSLDPVRREELGAEIKGWDRWVKTWKERLSSAEQIER